MLWLLYVQLGYWLFQHMATLNVITMKNTTVLSTPNLGSETLTWALGNGCVAVGRAVASDT